MTSTPVVGDDRPSREWSIAHRTLSLSTGSHGPLAVLNGRHPLLLPPGSVLQVDDPRNQW